MITPTRPVLRSHEEQPPLPLVMATSTVRREKLTVYEAVRRLRSSGHVVYRQGRQHSFDGKIASDEQIVALAEAEGVSA